MQRDVKLTAKEVALTVCFTALYTYFCFVPAFPIVGLPNEAITLAAITAPIIGMILGSYLGMLSTLLGGMIGLFFPSPFSPPSFISGIVTAAFAGMLHTNKRNVFSLTYFLLLLLFGFYPVGPVWLYPLFMWFQILGFLILISPLQSMALKNMRDPHNDSKLSFTLAIISLTSTLAGQIAGSLTYELVYSSLFDVDWALIWRLLMWVYPIERTIITLIATFIGVILYKVLTSANLMPFSVRTKQS